MAHPATAADASHEILALDPERSLAEFEVRVVWLIGVHGRFGAVHGTIDIDRFHSSASVDARIDANDVRMRSAGNETWARSAEFFDGEHYPQIQFVSDSFPLARLNSGGQLEGVLTIRGISHRERFEVAPSECPDARARACPVVAEGTILRSEFGMHSRRGVLSDKVKLNFSIYVQPPTEALQ